MATRVITSLILQPNGDPWKEGLVRFKLHERAYSTIPPETVPVAVVDAVTDENGNISVSLVSGLSSLYRVTLPDAKKFDIAVPDGPPTTLEALRAAYAGGPILPPVVEGPTGPTGPSGAAGPTGPTVDTTAFVQKSGDTMTGPLRVEAEMRSTVAGTHAESVILAGMGPQALLDKILTRPDIDDFTNAPHDHSSPAKGGLLPLPICDLGTVQISGFANDTIVLPVVPKHCAVGLLTVDTPGQAPSGSFIEISNQPSEPLPLGFELQIRSAASARVVTMVDSPFMRMQGDANVVISDQRNRVFMIQTATGLWVERSRAIEGVSALPHDHSAPEKGGTLPSPTCDMGSVFISGDALVLPIVLPSRCGSSRIAADPAGGAPSGSFSRITGPSLVSPPAGHELEVRSFDYSRPVTMVESADMLLEGGANAVLGHWADRVWMVRLGGDAWVEKARSIR